MPITPLGAAVKNNGGSTISSHSIDPVADKVSGVALATGHFMIMTVEGATASTITDPAGWNPLRKGIFGTRNGASWWRFRQSGDTTYGISTPSMNGAQVALEWWDGVDPTTPIHVLGALYTRPSSINTTPIPGITTTIPAYIVTVALEATTADDLEPTATFGSRLLWAPQTTTPQIHTTLINGFQQSSAGATGTNTVTYLKAVDGTANPAGNGWGFQVALTPAAGNAAPIPNFEGMRTGFDVAFTDTSTDPGGSIVATLWDFGDGSGTTVATNPTHTYAPGTYTVTLTVTDNLGATASTTRSLIVPSIPEAIPGNLSLYDKFSRYLDGTTPGVALTGQTWQMYSGPGIVTGGRMDSVEGTGAHYLYATSGSEIKYMASNFRFDTMSSTRSANGGTVLLMVVDNIASLGTRRFRMHLAVSPTGLVMSTAATPGGSLGTTVGGGLTTTKDVEHFVEVYMNGTAVQVFIDGVSRMNNSSAILADDTGFRQAVYESYYNNDGTDSRGRYADAYAVWGEWVTGSLPAAVSFTGSAPIVQYTRTGTLSLSPALTPSASVVQYTRTGSLGVGVALSGSATVVEQAVRTGTLPLSVTLSGQITGGALARDGQLPVAGDFIASPAIVRYTRTGILPLSLALSGDIAGGNLVRIGSLPVSVVLSGSAFTRLSRSGSLPIAIGLSGIATVPTDPPEPGTYQMLHQGQPVRIWHAGAELTIR